MKDKDSLSLPHYISSCLYVFAEVVLFSTANYTSFNSHVSRILELIANSDFLNSDSVRVLEALLMLTTNIVKSCGSECIKYKRDLFKILLQLGSIPGTAHLHNEVENTIGLLARHCGCSTSSELFSMELSSLLEEMKETYLDWNDGSADRFVFSLLCRNSNEAVVDHWDTILEIVGLNCTHGKQYSVRMDMLSLVEHFLDKESLQDTLCYYGDVFIKGILQPCIEWRSGIPNVKIREASILCLKKLIEKRLIEQESFQRNFLDIFNNLKSCMDDDFSSDIRYSSTVLLKLMINFTGNKMQYDDYKEVYPELLKRLDDSQDGIRLEASKAFEEFFEVLPEDWAPNLFEYMIENIYIHLDDSEEEIQQAISKVLIKAAKVHRDVVIHIGHAMSSKFKHQFVIDSLLTQLREDS